MINALIITVLLSVVCPFLTKERCISVGPLTLGDSVTRVERILGPGAVVPHMCFGDSSDAACSLTLRYERRNFVMYLTFLRPASSLALGGVRIIASSPCVRMQTSRSSLSTWTWSGIPIFSVGRQNTIPGWKSVSTPTAPTFESTFVREPFVADIATQGSRCVFSAAVV